MEYIKSLIRPLDKYIKREYSSFLAYLFFLLLAFLFVLPLLMANVDYIDDNARRLSGYYDWGSLGRFITEGIMRILTFSGSTMADMGQQMQILSIPVLAFAGWVFTRSLTMGKKATIKELLVGSLLVVNPFLLANLSFRYDSFSMILAYALAIFSAVILMTNKAKYGWLLSAVFLFITAALYQPMIVVSLVVILALFLFQYATEDRYNLKRVGIAAAVFAGSAAAYFGVLRLFTFSNIGGEARGGLVALNGAGLKEAFDNFTAGLQVVKLFYSGAGGRVVGLLLVATLIIAFVLLLRKRLRKQPWHVSLLVVFSPLLAGVSVMGPFMLMSSPLTAQVRTLASGVVIALLAAVIICACIRIGYRRMTVLLVIPLVAIMYCLNFSYVYSSALAQQRMQDMAVYDEVDDFLLNNSDTQAAEVVYIGGPVASPKVVQSQLEKRPLLERMDIAGDNSLWYLWTTLSDRMATKQAAWYVFSYEQEVMRKEVCAVPGSGKVYEHPYFTVYKKDRTYTVWLTNPSVGRNTFCSEARLR